jgi:hypothetical protein
VTEEKKIGFNYRPMESCRNCKSYNSFEFPDVDGDTGECNREEIKSSVNENWQCNLHTAITK